MPFGFFYMCFTSDSYFPSYLQSCDRCQWISPYGVLYDLSIPCEHQFTVWMETPKAAQIRFGACSKVECEGYDKAMACVLVPGKQSQSNPCFTTTGFCDHLSVVAII